MMHLLAAPQKPKTEEWVVADRPAEEGPDLFCRILMGRLQEGDVAKVELAFFHARRAKVDLS